MSAKKIYFWLISPENIIPKLIKVFFFFLVFFLDSSGLHCATLPWMLFLPSVFLIVKSLTVTLMEASEAYISLDPPNKEVRK